MSNQSETNRKQNYVDKSVQGGLVRRVLIHWVYFFGVTAFAFIVLQTLLGDPAVSILERMQDVVREYALLGILTLMLLPAFMLDTIRFSNRFVGPIVRLRRGLRELGETGTTDELRFRETDFWIEVAGEFNRCRSLIETQRCEIEELRKQNRQPATMR